MIKKGFTLSEVLITLGIIGVVAALTIPGLITQYKAKRLHSQFMKSYSVIQQAFKQMSEDDVSIDPTTYKNRTFYQTFMKYFNGATDCGFYGEKCVSGTNYTSFDGKDKSVGFSEDRAYSIFDDGQFLLPDGTLIIIENMRPQLWVHVDLNGYKNPPNRLGYDLFTFDFLDEELRTMGDKDTLYHDMEKYCNIKSTTKFNGIACAQKAKENSDYFKDLAKEIK